MKKLKTPIYLACSLMLVTACQKETLTEVSTPEGNTPEVAAESAGPLTVNDEIIQRLKTNYFNVGEVDVIDFLLPDGTTVPRYLVEGDITFSREELENLPKEGEVDSKNYSTNNLVTPRTLTIVGYTASNTALNTKERNALQLAVANYNNLKLKIRFTLTFASNYTNKDIVVYNNPSLSGSGGSSGFPGKGNPYKYVQLYGLNGYSTGVLEHVITHEIGHCVGLRHSDWSTRQSCGLHQSEGQGTIGANPVPGTTAGYDPTSIMLACFNSGVGGNFNANDIKALNYLY